MTGYRGRVTSETRSDTSGKAESVFVCVMVGVGVGVGAATQLLQGVLPGDANWAANSLSAWLVVAFGAASRAPRVRSAALGAVALLLAALVAYEVVGILATAARDPRADSGSGHHREPDGRIAAAAGHGCCR